jgi:tRNA (cytidine/uridine-2'-O-)-methyltransferase
VSRLLDVVLYEPEIAPNTGNSIRLCANTGARLHLIRPLGFEMDDRRLRRAGLDYHEYAEVRVHDDWEAYCRAQQPRRVFAFTTRGERLYSEVQYLQGDSLVFGPETRGLPAELLERIPAELRLYLPMRPGSRSLNLSNTVAVAVFEAWRQWGFPR